MAPLKALEYYGTMVQRGLRGYPQLGTYYAERRLLMYFISSLVVNEVACLSFVKEVARVLLHTMICLVKKEKLHSESC